MTPQRRLNIIKGQGGRCLRCKTKDNLTLDHIVPLSKGGGSHRGNFQVLCKACNLLKGAMTIDYREGIKGAEQRGQKLLQDFRVAAREAVVIYVADADGSGFVPAREALLL